MHMKKYKLTTKKTHKYDNRNLFKSKKTTYNKTAASKMKVADWELKLWSLWSPYGFLLTGGSRECRQWTGENNTFKNFLSTSSTIASVSKHSLAKW